MRRAILAFGFLFLFSFALFSRGQEASRGANLMPVNRSVLESPKPPQSLGQSLGQKCRRIFSSRSAGGFPVFALQTPLAQSAYQNIYAKTPALRKIFPKKQMDNHLSSLEGLIKLLDEAPSNPKIKKHLGYMPSLEPAIKKIPDMIRFLEEGGKNSEDIYSRQVFSAALAALGKHVPVYLKDDQPAQLDWPRLNRILKTLSEFDRDRGYVSFFRIKEAVEEAYSLREYIFCK